MELRNRGTENGGGSRIKRGGGGGGTHVITVTPTSHLLSWKLLRIKQIISGLFFVFLL